MTNRTEPNELWLRRLFAALIAALMLAASAYLSQDMGTAQAVRPALLPDVAAPGERIIGSPSRPGGGSELSVPSADSVFSRTITNGFDDTPPSF